MGIILETMEENTENLRDDITVVFTSCGRLDLLSITVESFLKYNTHPISKFIIIDNSGNQNIGPILNTMFGKKENFEIIINETNIGQVGSIDKAYSLIETEYIFHCEDDWLFFDYGFIELSLEILKLRKDISNVNIRIRFDGERGSMHPIIGPYTTPKNNIYYEYQQNYLGEWHGFSWNPGLRRLSDYKNIMPYKKYKNEQGVNLLFKNLGFKAACLEKYYCKHIGGNNITEKSNT